MSRLKQLAVLTAAAMAFSACDDAGVAAPGDEASFTIVMAPESSATGTSSLALSLMGPEGPSSAVVPLSKVESILLPIGGVEALRSGGEGSGWIEAGSVNETVDLLSLPADGITLTDSSLPQGQYRTLRFWLTDEATIVINEDVRVGRHTFEAGEHPLVIPSAENAGVRLFTHFDVDENGQVLTVLVDGEATVRRLIATGSGTLRIAPALRVENRNGDDVGNSDDDDDADDADDDADDIEVEGLITSVDGDAATFTLDHDGNAVTIVIGADTELDFGDGLESWADVVDAFTAGTSLKAEAEGQWDETNQLVASEVEFEIVDSDEDD